MKYKNILRLLMLALIAFNINAQVKVIKSEKLELANNIQANMPRFSPDGSKIYFTNMDFDGIWEFNLLNKGLKQITDAPKSGFEFSLSQNGELISYRTTYYSSQGAERIQEIYTQNLITGEKVLEARSGELSTPKFAGNTLIFTDNYQAKNLEKNESMSDVSILGIELTKIAISNKGQKIILDPLGNGSYIWPTLSNDKKMLSAYEMGKGAFISNLNGNVIRTFGKLDGAVWLHGDDFLIYMDDKDDGHNITASEIAAISVNTGEKFNLTTTDNQIELYPSCSPVDKRIVYTTASGEIYILTLSEEN